MRSSSRLRCRVNKWPIRIIFLTRAVAIGLSYYSVAKLPGLTSSFVAIFACLIPFDLMVAMDRIRIRGSYLKDLVTVLLPGIAGTAINLIIGIFLGASFGVGTKLGIPLVVAAVLTAGLAYSLAGEIRGNISSYVGMIAALGVLDRMKETEFVSGAYLGEQVVPVALSMVYGTFSGLVYGWLIGFVAGFVTRLVLPRGYRSARSAAYAPPLAWQRFRDVMNVGDEVSLTRLIVEPGSFFDGKTIAETGLRARWGASILSISREGTQISSPGGGEILQAGDGVLIVSPVASVSEFSSFAKGCEEYGS